MDTVTIQLLNQKAYQLLKDMEALNLIVILKNSPKISSIRGEIITPMSEEEIDKQLNELSKGCVVPDNNL